MRLARRSLALRPAHSRSHLYVTCYTEGFSHFVSSMTAPVASGWSGCRVGTLTHWKAPPSHGAHVKPTLQTASVDASNREGSVLIPEEAAPRFRDDVAPRNGMMPPPDSEMIAPPIAE